MLATPRPGSLVAPLDDDSDDGMAGKSGALNARFIYQRIVRAA